MCGAGKINIFISRGALQGRFCVAPERIRWSVIQHKSDGLVYGNFLGPQAKISPVGYERNLFKERGRRTQRKRIEKGLSSSDICMSLIFCFVYRLTQMQTLANDLLAEVLGRSLVEQQKFLWNWKVLAHSKSAEKYRHENIEFVCTIDLLNFHYKYNWFKFCNRLDTCVARVCISTRLQACCCFISVLYN